MKELVTRVTCFPALCLHLPIMLLSERTIVLLRVVLHLRDLPNRPVGRDNRLVPVPGKFYEAMPGIAVARLTRCLNSSCFGVLWWLGY
jgi:hypothetical protein